MSSRLSRAYFSQLLSVVSPMRIYSVLEEFRTVKLGIYENGVAGSCPEWAAVFCDRVAKRRRAESTCLQVS